MEQILDFVKGVYTQHFSEICVPQTGEGDSKTNRRNDKNVF